MELNRKAKPGKTNSLIMRVIVCALSAVLTIGMLSGCGGDSETTSNGNIKISIGNWPATEGTSLDLCNTLKENFENANPNITIVPDTWTFDVRTFYPKAEAGLLPTKFRSYATELDKIVDGEYCADLTNALERAGYLDLLSDPVKNLISKNGKVYAIPSALTLVGVAVNMEMFEAAGLIEDDGAPMQPSTWEELAEFAVKIKEATGKPGFILNTSNNTGGWLFSNIAWSYGVDFMEKDADGKWKATFNTDEMVQAMQYVWDLKWKYNVLPENNLIDNTEGQKLLATGGGAMLLTGSDIGDRLQKFEMDPRNLGMLAVPAGPKRHVALLGATLEYVSAGSTEEQIDAVIKWMDYMGEGVAVSDESKENMRNTYADNKAKGVAIGIPTLAIWNEKAEKTQFVTQITEEFKNIRPNAEKNFSVSLDGMTVEWQAEEPVCAQDLYGIIDNCIQEILNNKNADIKAIVAKANSDFQKNFLDNVENN